MGVSVIEGFSQWLIGREFACIGVVTEDCGFAPWVGKIPWRRAWQPTPVFLPGESHGQRAWQAIVHMVAKSQTWLKRLNTHACMQMNLEDIMLSEIRQDTERHILYYLTYTRNLKNPDSEPAIARAGVWQKWGDGQWYKLSVTGWISSGNLMHSKVVIINNTVFSWNLLRE